MPLNAVWYLIKNKLILQKIQTNMESKESYQISLIWNLHVEWKRKQVLMHVNSQDYYSVGITRQQSNRECIFKHFLPKMKRGEEILLPPQFRITKKMTHWSIFINFECLWISRLFSNSLLFWILNQFWTTMMTNIRYWKKKTLKALMKNLALAMKQQISSRALI